MAEEENVTETPDDASAPELREAERIDDPEEITRIVEGLVKGQIFHAGMVPEHESIGMVFMPLMLGGLTHLKLESIGNVYEWLDKASPRSCNGLPMFLSCKVIHKDDWDIIREKCIKTQEAMEAAMRGE